MSTPLNPAILAAIRRRASWPIIAWKNTCLRRRPVSLSPASGLPRPGVFTSRRESPAAVAPIWETSCRRAPELQAGPIIILMLMAMPIVAAIPLLLPLMMLAPVFWCKRNRTPPRTRHGHRVAKRKLRDHHMPQQKLPNPLVDIRRRESGERSVTDYSHSRQLTLVALEERTFYEALAEAIQAYSQPVKDQTTRVSTLQDVESIALLSPDSCMKQATEYPLGTQLSLLDFDIIRASGPCFVIKVNRHSAVPFYLRFRWAGRCAIAAAAWQPAADIAGTPIADTSDDLGCVVTGTHGKHRTWFDAMYHMPRSFTRFCIMSFLLSQVQARDEPNLEYYVNKKNTADQTETLDTSLGPLINMNLRTISLLALLLCAFFAVCLMFPGRQQGGGNGGGRGGGNRRDPPKWSPENQASYPFSVWIKDLMTWSLIVSDIDMSQQTAMVIMNLEGAAKEIARQLTFVEMTTGGTITDENGVASQHDALSYLLYHLAHRFAPLGEEARLQAMAELYNFTRKSNEHIDGLITRFETVRHRAREQDGGITINWEGTSWLLVKAVGCSQQQLLTLLQPFNSTMPRTEVEYGQLTTSLRRMGHVLERSPYNIASSLGGQNNRGPFFTEFLRP